MDTKVLKFDKTITTWDEAIALGNGVIGALIWGNPNALRFSIDRCDMWDCSDAPKAGGRYTFANFKRLAEEGKLDEIYEIFDMPYKKPAPTKLPAGKIIIDLGCDDNVESTLDMEKAAANVRVGDITLDSFIHADREIGYIKISSENVKFKIENPEYGRLGDTAPAEPNSLKNLHYEAPSLISDTSGNVESIGFTQKISDNMTYGLFVKIKREAGETFAVYTARAGKNASLLVSEADALLNGAINDCYDESFARHAAWWCEYWSKSFLTLPDKFFEKNWYIGNYLLASCSRKGHYPMPLQGVWTADDGMLPPWKGDYHHDLNTQLSYYSYLKSNHIPEGECFVDYLLSLEAKAEAFAREFYGCDVGLCLPSVMDIEGNSLGGWPMYSLSTTNTAWLCKAIGDHYRYTRDEDYLRTRAYPYIKKYGLFLEAFMHENDEGKLVLPMSSSPEIHDNTKAAYLTPNSTYDLSLIRYTFTQLGEFARHLGYDSDAEKWDALLSKMDEIPVDADNCLKLARDERMAESHRHMSHLMPIHPLRQIRYESEEEKRIIDASVADVEKLGIENYVGYSFCWLAEFYAIKRDPKKACENLSIFWNYYCLPNGFHCNGDYQDKLGGMTFVYRPFTLEGNFCAIDALQEMFLLDRDGEIVIAPAIPSEWKDYSFKLRSINGVLVTVAVENGRPISVTLEAYADTDLKICFMDEELTTVSLKKGETRTITA